MDKAVAESGFTKEFIEEHGEYSTLSSVLLGTSAPFDSYYYAEDPQDKIFKIQRRIIKKFAQVRSMCYCRKMFKLYFRAGRY